MTGPHPARSYFIVRGVFAVLLCIVGTAAPAQAEPRGSAQAYPSRPVRFLIPFAAAGSNDAVARILAYELTKIWKQQVVADNRDWL